MAEATDTGIATLDLAGWQERLAAVWAAGLAGEVAYDPETPQGQIIGIDAITWTAVDELLLHVANGLSLDAAAGVQLDILGTTRNIMRRAETRSSVTATMTGTASVPIAAGSRVLDTDGNAWVLAETVMIGSGGSVDGTFRADEFGPIELAAGALTRIATPVSGWDAITNADAGTPGRARETDTSYRNRLKDRSAVGTQTTVEAMAVAIAEVTGVTRSRVLDNATGAEVTTGGLTIAARAVMVVVEGGTGVDIGMAIRATKGLGTPTSGANTVTVEGVTYRYQRTATKDLDIDLEIDTGAGFPSDGVTRIENALIAWVDALDIGAVLDLGRIYEALNTVPGYTVSSLMVRQNPASPEPLVQALGNEVYALDRNNITTTIT